MPTRLLHALLLFAAVFALYRPSLEYGFVWDDQIYVAQNVAVQDWSYAGAAFTSPQTTWSANAQYNLAAWRPLRNISYLIDHSLYGLNPMGFHLTNILLHAIAAVLLYLLIRRLIELSDRRDDDPVAAQGPKKIAGLAALAGAAFWAVHPVQTEIVAWIKSRDDLLSACFFFAALLVALPRGHVHSVEAADEMRSESPLRSDISLPSTEKRQQAVALQMDNASTLSSAFSLLLFICALLSKENTIILAGVYPIILLFISLRFGIKRFLLSNLPLALGFIVTAVIYLAIHHVILGRTSQAPYPGETALQTILTMLHAFTRYVQLIVWPWPPTTQLADYDGYAIITNPLNLRAILGIALLISCIFIALRPFAPSRLRFNIITSANRLAAMGAALFLLALLPYSNLIPMMQIMAERFLYLPLAGVAMVVAAAIMVNYELRITNYEWRKKPSEEALTKLQSSPEPLIQTHNAPIQSSREAPPQFVIRNLKFVITFLVIAALAFQTHRRLPVWASELTLFTANREANPTSWRPADLHIKALLKSDQANAAVDAATRALRQFPRDPDIVRTAALAHLLAGNETSGTQLTHYAISLQPNDPRASHTLQQWRRMQSKNEGI